MKYAVRILILSIFHVYLGNFPIYGQACCTLQGVSGTAAYGSLFDFDGVDFSYPENFTQIQFQFTGSDDWDRNSFIINGPLFGYSLKLSRLFGGRTLLGAAILGDYSSVSELLTNSQSKSLVVFNNVQLRATRFSRNRNHAFWVRFTQPFVSLYSNQDFPFTLSPPRSLEFGFGYVKKLESEKGEPQMFSFWIKIRKDEKIDNLYRFVYYSSGQMAIRYRIYSSFIPFFSLYIKHGALKPLDTPIYEKNFPASLFAYGLLGAGMEYKSNFLKNIIFRLYGTYPIVVWSNNTLPAGFDEKPLIGLSIVKNISFVNVQ